MQNRSHCHVPLSYLNCTNTSRGAHGLRLGSNPSLSACISKFTDDLHTLRKSLRKKLGWEFEEEFQIVEDRFFERKSEFVKPESQIIFVC
jgi:hypothetical protein